jgi:hypothetical protein
MPAMSKKVRPHYFDKQLNAALAFLAGVVNMAQVQKCSPLHFSTPETVVSQLLSAYR